MDKPKKCIETHAFRFTSGSNGVESLYMPKKPSKTNIRRNRPRGTEDFKLFNTRIPISDVAKLRAYSKSRCRGASWVVSDLINSLPGSLEPDLL